MSFLGKKIKLVIVRCIAIASLSGAAILAPAVALAGDPITVDFIFTRASDLLNRSIVLIIAVATVVFMWGVIQYVIAGGDEKKLKEGKSYMIYGIVGLAVMVAVWGFVNLLVFTIFGGSAGDPFSFTIPHI